MSLLVDIQEDSVQIFGLSNGENCSDFYHCPSFGYFNFSASSSFNTSDGPNPDSRYPEDGMDTLGIGGQQVKNFPFTLDTDDYENDCELFLPPVYRTFELLLLQSR